MQESQIKESMLRNFEKQRGQFQPESVTREWAKIRPEKMYNLLRSCAGICAHDARYLVIKMTQKKWTIKATAHEGGLHSSAPLHITLQVHGERAYHLNVRENVRQGLHIYQITKGNNEP